MRFALSLLAALLLAGCATPNIRPEDISKLGAAPTQADIDKIAHGEPLHRLDYLVDGQPYTFEIYEAADTAKYYGLLFQGAKLIAVDVSGVNSRIPGPADCMLFPPKSGMDVEACLRTANQTLQAASVDLSQPVTPDQQTLQRMKNESAGAVAEGVTYTVLMAPIVVPIMAVMLPLIEVEKASEKSVQQSLSVKLGDSYQDIQVRVEQLPERERSVTDGSGTVLVPSSFSSIPAAAFGLQGGKVIWLQFDPPSECGGGFMLWGMQCTLRTAVAPWYAPHKPRPPVIDEWENLAVYYTPPPQFDVLGETTGKADGFSAQSRMENAFEDMKKRARNDGATGVLVYPLSRPADQEPTAAPAAGTGMPVYGATGTAPFGTVWVRGLEIYVPGDADSFLKAAQLHATTCGALSQKKDDAKDAYKAVKDTGTPDAVAAAKQSLQAAEDAEDAAYCGNDNWYAEQMVGHQL